MIHSLRDPGLRAHIVGRRPLTYHQGADVAEDRPAHVRAASAITAFQGRLVVVQDDTNVLGLVEVGGEISSALLPAGHGGRRVFDAAWGTKQHKLDLEACVTDGEWFVALGSGSTPARERIVRWRVGGPPELVDAHALYGHLRARAEFSGSELNIEGAALSAKGSLLLLQRGNGAPSAERPPVDAVGELSWQGLLTYLSGDGPPPALERVVPCQLGALRGVRLTFTDGCLWRGRLLYLAGAEASPDVVQDGEVVGAALGELDLEREVGRWTPLLDERGAPAILKAEGLMPHPERPDHLLLVVDPDDGDQPAQLLEVELRGWDRPFAPG